MGEQLSHEFSMNGVNTGRTTPPMQTTVNMPASPDIPGSGGPQQVTIPGQPVYRMSFLQSFLANLGPSLAGSIAPAPGRPEGTGFAGAAANLQSVGNQNRQYSLQVDAARRAQEAQASQLQLQAQQIEEAKQRTSQEAQLFPARKTQAEASAAEAALLLKIKQNVMQLANDPQQVNQIFSSLTSHLGPTNENENTILQGGFSEFRDALRNGSFNTKPIADAASKVAQNRFEEQKSGAADDRKYEAIKANQIQGLPISKPDNAFMQAYERRKQLSPLAAINVQGALTKGNNAALTNVPPHLVAPATAAVEKANQEYADAKSVSDRMAATMDAAKKGNVVAYKIIPQEGTLQITTSQGVHRINKTEIDQYAGGGSLWQRLEGHLGGALTGKSIPDSVLKDMADIQDIQARGAQSRYLNKIKGINDTYGSTFKPVDMAGLTPASTAPKGIPTGATGKAKGSDGQWHYHDAKGNDLGVVP